MEKEKTVTITESELWEALGKMVSELLSRPEEEHGEEPTAEVESESSNEPDDEAPTPTEKPSAHGQRNVTTGFIAAVRQDGEGFRIRDQWYKVTGSTRIETDLAKGKKVKVYFSFGDNCVFANAVYDASEPKPAAAF
ncbi:MAG: hypothetical protein ACNS63_09440 [Candidatus Nitrospinota bacterium M3_3B_026]